MGSYSTVDLEEKLKELTQLVEHSKNQYLINKGAMEMVRNLIEELRSGEDNEQESQGKTK